MRKKAVELVDGGMTVADVARELGWSRKTVYKWVERSEAGDNLTDRSRARHDIERFEGEAAEWLLGLRHRYRWGPTKLLDYGRRERPEVAWPARSTVAALLQRRGLITPRRRVARHSPLLPLGPTPSEPNARWTMDFKGDFRIGDGTYVKPFTLRDAASRMVLDIFVTPTVSTKLVLKRLDRAFRQYGKPLEIQSDTGQPFASTGLAKLSTVSVWLMRHGVAPILSRPGRPQDNGAHERMHRDYKADTTRPPATTMKGQQSRSDTWVHYFNEVRPHEALGGDVPAWRWKLSERPYDPKVEPPEYPRWWERRHVDMNGDFSWAGEHVTCTKALRNEDIALEPLDWGLWRIHYATFSIGILDDRDEPHVIDLRSA